MRLEMNVIIESNWNEINENFEDMDLNEELLRDIYAIDYKKPSAVQKRAITPCIRGHNMILIAESGSGKTTASLIATLQQLDLSIKNCQALILAPTRELTKQIETMVQMLGKLLGVTCHAYIGGIHTTESISKLQQGVQIVIGTPGRICDLVIRKALDTHNIKTVVLDDADEILCRGFKEQIHDIFNEIRKNVQVLVLSDTIPTDINDVIEIKDPIRICIKNNALLLKDIKQLYINVGKEECKFESLLNFCFKTSIVQFVVFCDDRNKTVWLAEQMKAKNFAAAALHEDMEERERESIIKEFRCGLHRALVTTDFMTNFPEVQQVQLVVNYDLPSDFENYTNRVGRRGRFGRKNYTAINFVTDIDKHRLRHIEDFYNTKINEMSIDFKDLI